MQLLENMKSLALSLDQMFYLATGFVDIQSWKNFQLSSYSDCSRGHNSYLSSKPESQCFTVAKEKRSTVTSSLSNPVFSVGTRWTSTCLVLLLLCISNQLADACSSRSTPKPRPPPAATPSPSPGLRPNITFQTYACPPAYAAWYCLNGATCFTVKIAESILYNCECSEGYMGQRCEFKNLDGSYLPLREKILLERASIAGGASVAVILVVILSIAFYACIRKRRKEQPTIIAGAIVEVTVDRLMIRTLSTWKTNANGAGSAQARLSQVDGRGADDLGHPTLPAPSAMHIGSHADENSNEAHPTSTKLETT